jgi:Leucine-rich repeat (LRR) protein
MLIVDNMIKSIPEAVGQCKFLVFLNLLNCPRLTKLPKSIVNLTCLEFLSTSGSGIDENSIPESAKEYFIEDEFMGYIQPNFPPEMKQHCPATFDF